MPVALERYRSSPEFTHDSVSAALLHNHARAERVWAQIVILKGSRRYIIDHPSQGAMPEEHFLSPECSGIVRPKQFHHIEILGPVRFRVDFYR
jgi:tellurite resistance-related uncharacterized protein